MLLHQTMLLEAGVAVHDPKTPINRDAAYIKKVSGLKVGKVAAKSHFSAKNNLYIGDWVRIADEGKHHNKYGYIVGEVEEVDKDGQRTWKVKVDISTGPEPEVVEVVYYHGHLRRSLKWSDNDNLVNSVGGATAAKAKASKEKEAAKKAAVSSNTDIPTDPVSYVYGDMTAKPNMDFPAYGKPIYVDETKPRTAEEKKAAKDFIKDLEANYKIHTKFVEDNPSPNDKTRQQVLKNAKMIVDACKKLNDTIDNYIGLIKVLNRTVNEGDRELFDEARKELHEAIAVLYEENRLLKMKMSYPKYASRARVLTAIGVNQMFTEAKKVDEFYRKRDWSKEKLERAKKSSEKMKLFWRE